MQQMRQKGWKGQSEDMHNVDPENLEGKEQQDALRCALPVASPNSEGHVPRKPRQADEKEGDSSDAT